MTESIHKKTFYCIKHLNSEYIGEIDEKIRKKLRIIYQKKYKYNPKSKKINEQQIIIKNNMVYKRIYEVNHVILEDEKGNIYNFHDFDPMIGNMKEEAINTYYSNNEFCSFDSEIPYAWADFIVYDHFVYKGIFPKDISEVEEFFEDFMLTKKFVKQKYNNYLIKQTKIRNLQFIPKKVILIDTILN